MLDFFFGDGIALNFTNTGAEICVRRLENRIYEHNVDLEKRLQVVLYEVVAKLAVDDPESLGKIVRNVPPNTSATTKRLK